MLLIILGAGATYDSDPKRPPVGSGARQAERPPITAELFDGRFAAFSDYPDCLRIIPRLRATVAASLSIEEEMEVIRADSLGKIPSLGKAIACMRGYLRAVVENAEAAWYGGHDGVTNQLRLFAEVEDWREAAGEKVRVVTFNYDLLAEHAIQRLGLGIGFGAPQTYVADDRYRVFKLHGSINWWRQLDVVSDAGWRDPLPKTQEHFMAYEPAGIQGGPTWAPAISVPLQTKTDSEFECPDEHLALLREELPAVDRVISVGWRGHEAHFMALWQKHPPVNLVGQLSISGSHDTAQYVANQLSMNIRTTTLPVVGDNGFSAFMDSNRLKPWLG